MECARAIVDELRGPTRELRARIPQVWDGFAKLHSEAQREGVLSAKTKELMALAIGVTQRCDGCIAYHARAAAQRGATEDEVAEALGVAILMSGGPGTVYGARAWRSFLEFVNPTSGSGPDAPD
ncbi:carboxymuconolactone decarboxylase family protein [Nitriliruptoraceae bacterium ZYF776]|nr:carboxymuconolactone decarboxylase family protein [Profundirhabdus halotolerans]